jgi:hypothetical protein
MRSMAVDRYISVVNGSGEYGFEGFCKVTGDKGTGISV